MHDSLDATGALMVPTPVAASGMQRMYRIAVARDLRNSGELPAPDRPMQEAPIPVIAVAITSMALENYVEMRDSIVNPRATLPPLPAVHRG